MIPIRLRGMPDYLVVHHMEPDHSSSILNFTEAYKSVCVISNKKNQNKLEDIRNNLNAAILEK